MEASKKVCPVCLEDIHTEASVVRPCDHAFCQPCITRWIEQTPTCPLCLKNIDTVTQSWRSDEDLKEQTYEVKVTPESAKKPAEEEFECFDHDYFVHEFRQLFKQAKDTEFSLKSQIGIKKKALQLEKNYQLALHMKQEIEMKLNYLGRVKKINPKDLLGDIQHFCELLAKINYSGDQNHYDNYSYADDAHYEDDCCYGEDAEIDPYSMYSVAVTKTSKTKKKSKAKPKNKKEGVEHENTRIMLS